MRCHLFLAAALLVCAAHVEAGAVDADAVETDENEAVQESAFLDLLEKEGATEADTPRRDLAYRSFSSYRSYRSFSFRSYRSYRSSYIRGGGSYIVGYYYSYTYNSLQPRYGSSSGLTWIVGPIFAFIFIFILCCVCIRRRQAMRSRGGLHVGQINEMLGNNVGDPNVYTSPRHPHPMTKKAFTATYGVHSCEGCGNAIVGIGYRCMSGCDYDLCQSCMPPMVMVAQPGLVSNVPVTMVQSSAFGAVAQPGMGVAMAQPVAQPGQPGMAMAMPVAQPGMAMAMPVAQPAMAVAVAGRPQSAAFGATPIMPPVAQATQQPFGVLPKQ